MNVIRPISALFFLAFFAVSGQAETVGRITKLPSATLRELAAIPSSPGVRHETRHEERRALGPHTRDGRTVRSEGIAAPALTTQATIAPPPISVGFLSDSSLHLSPADAAGAVSKTHVVAASNAGLVVHTRTGAPVAKLTLKQFWSAGSQVVDIYDPRVAYDAIADRWIVIAIRDANAVLLSVSASGDPTGSWTRYTISVDDCDFSRLALTRDTIVVSTLLGYSGACAVLSFSKAELYAAANAPAVRGFNLSGDAIPVSSPDSPVEYFLLDGDSDLTIRRLDQLNQPARVVDAGFTWQYPQADMAPQAGTASLLDMGYGDIQTAVYRGGWIYAVQRIGSSTRTTDSNALLWWKVDPDGVKAAELGLIDSPANTTYAYPSLAVNRDGGMLITFCALSSTTYPSASFVYRDPAGRVSTPSVVRTGDSSITNTDRWGDYTTVAEDPNGRDFWIGQIYATRHTWETWWANVSVPPARARAVRH